MIQSLQLLIDALRDELQHYGEMLALLDRQQEYLIARAASEVFQSISLIKAQGSAIQQARARRAPRRVELPHPPGIALPSLRRAYIFDAIAGP